MGPKSTLSRDGSRQNCTRKNVIAVELKDAMTSGQNAENSQCSIVTGPLKSPCRFCKTKTIDELKLGPVYQHKDIIIHYFCLLTASSLPQDGEDHEGILGFYLTDILKEAKISGTRVCSFCKLKGATVICCSKYCKKWFHLICGLERHSLHQFFGKFKSFCGQHRPKQRYNKRLLERSTEGANEVDCPICYEHLDIKKSYDFMWAPCCKKNAWFHRDCVQRLALSAGYFFKCPLCNNEKEFCDAMKKFGIYIPQRDATWEQVPHAYEDLLYVHKECDASKCICPQGRRHEGKTNTNWELIRCNTCGSQGIHLSCGRLKRSNPDWVCQLCTTVIGTDERVARARTPSPIPTRKEVAIFEDIDSQTSDGDSRASSPVIEVADSPRSNMQSDSDYIFGSPKRTEEREATERLSPQVKRLKPCPKRYKKRIIVETRTSAKSVTTENGNNAEVKIGTPTSLARARNEDKTGGAMESALETTEETAVKTDEKTAVKTDEKTAVKTDEKTAVKIYVKTGVQTDAKTDEKSPVRIYVNTGVKTGVKADEKTNEKTDEMVTITDSDSDNDDDIKVLEVHRALGYNSLIANDGTELQVHPVSEKREVVYEIHADSEPSLSTVCRSPKTPEEIETVSKSTRRSKPKKTSPWRAVDPELFYPHRKPTSSNRSSVSSLSGSALDTSGLTQNPVNPNLHYEEIQLGVVGASTSYSPSTDCAYQRVFTHVEGTSDILMRSRSEQHSVKSSLATTHSQNADLTVEKSGRQCYRSLPYGSRSLLKSSQFFVSSPIISSVRSERVVTSSNSQTWLATSPCPNQLPTANAYTLVSESSTTFHHSTHNQSVSSTPSSYSSVTNVRTSYEDATGTTGRHPAPLDSARVCFAASYPVQSARVAANGSYLAPQSAVWFTSLPSTSGGPTALGQTSSPNAKDVSIMSPLLPSEPSEPTDTGLNIKITNVRHSNEYDPPEGWSFERSEETVPSTQEMAGYAAEVPSTSTGTRLPGTSLLASRKRDTSDHRVNNACSDSGEKQKEASPGGGTHITPSPAKHSVPEDKDRSELLPRPDTAGVKIKSGGGSMKTRSSAPPSNGSPLRGEPKPQKSSSNRPCPKRFKVADSAQPVEETSRPVSNGKALTESSTNTRTLPTPKSPCAETQLKVRKCSKCNKPRRQIR